MLKSLRKKKNKEPDVVAASPAGDAPPNVDSRLPWTAYRDQFTLKNYWKTVSRKNEECSKTFLRKFLQTNPDIKQLYPTLKGLNLDDDNVIADNTAFESTATELLSVFDDVMTDIDANKVDNAIKRLNGFGQQHKSIVGWTADTFTKMEEPFVYMVSVALEDRFNDKSEALFRKFFQFCTKHFAEGFKA